MGPVLGIVPSRGGSKGIPRKNIRLLAGRPLLHYAVMAAQKSGVIDRLILSTDSEEIAQVGHHLGVEVPFLRPSELAQDDTPMLLVVEHAVTKLEETDWSPEVVILLQPTAPLRRPEHIVKALTILRTTGCDSVVSVVEVPKHFSPHYVMKIQDGRLVNYLAEGQAITRRQDAPAAYSRDGTVYVVWRKILMEDHSLYGTDCYPLILSAEESVNLDTLQDWVLAEQKIAGANLCTGRSGT